MKKFLLRSGLLIGGVGLFGILISAVLPHWLTPSHDREWELGQERLPIATVHGEELTIGNVRNFTWKREAGKEVSNGRYETHTYHLDHIQGVDVFISHFSAFDGLAHLFFSFTFTDSDPLVLSVESRREVGESFSPLLGLFSQYELIMVAATERDMVGVRTQIRNEQVYRYPTTLTLVEADELLRALTRKMQRLESTPQFYDTLRNNCTNFVTEEIERIANIHFPRSLGMLLPGYFPDILANMHLLERARDQSWNPESYRVDDRLDPNDSDFSKKLRQ